MRIEQKTISLTPDQVDFIKSNYLSLTRIEIAKQLGITVGKLGGNMRMLDLNYKQITKPKIVKELTSEGFYNEQDYISTLYY